MVNSDWPIFSDPIERSNDPLKLIWGTEIVHLIRQVHLKPEFRSFFFIKNAKQTKCDK